MKKSKLLSPGEIINIINSSFLIITSFNIFISLINLELVQYYVLAFIINIFLIILGIGLIVMSSLCLAFTKRKTYTLKGEKFSLLSIILEVIIIALEVANVVLTIKMFNRVNPMLFVCIFVFLTTTMFLLTSFKESVVGSKEEIETILKPKIKENIVEQQATILIKNKPNSINICFTEQINKLEKLHNLFQNGVITKEEYEEKKKNILSQIK